MHNEITTRSATIRMINEWVIENVIHDNAELDVEDIMEIKRINGEISAGRCYTVLVDSGSFTSITDEGRKLSASKDFQQQTIAKAILVNSLSQRIIGKLYMRFNKPMITTKIFSDRERALEWLNSISN